MRSSTSEPWPKSMERTRSERFFSITMAPEFWDCWVINSLESMEACPPPPLEQPYMDRNLEELFYADSYGASCEDDKRWNHHRLSRPSPLSVQPPPHKLLKKGQDDDDGSTSGTSFQRDRSWSFNEPQKQQNVQDQQQQRRRNALFAGMDLLATTFALLDETQDKKHFTSLTKETQEMQPQSSLKIETQEMQTVPSFTNETQEIQHIPCSTNDTTTKTIVESDDGAVMKPTSSIRPMHNTNHTVSRLEEYNESFGICAAEPSPVLFHHCPQMMPYFILTQTRMLPLGTVRYLSMMVYPLLFIIILFFCDLIRTRNRIDCIEQKQLRRIQNLQQEQEQHYERTQQQQRRLMMMHQEQKLLLQQQQEHYQQLLQLQLEDKEKKSEMFILRIICPDRVEWPVHNVQEEWQPFASPSSHQQYSNMNKNGVRPEKTPNDFDDGGGNSAWSATVTIQVHFLLVNFLNRLIRQQVLEVPSSSSSANGSTRKAVYMVVGSGTTSVELLLTKQETLQVIVQQLEHLGIGPKMGLVYSYSIPEDMVRMPLLQEVMRSEHEQKENEHFPAKLVQEHDQAESKEVKENMLKTKKEEVCLIPVHPSAMQQQQPASDPSSSVFITELPEETSMSVTEEGFVNIPSSVLSM